jgi:hypothetical protein
MPAEISEKIWGDRFDAWTTLWLIEHLADRITSWNWTPETTEILHPLGYNLWSFGHIALQLIGGVMVAVGIPLVVTYNLLLIFGIGTSALGAHALGREMTQSHLAGLVAGITFATTPYLYAEARAGCIELVAAGLLPFHACMLVRLIRKPDWRRFAWATAILAIIGPFNWYYTLFAGMLGMGFVIWQLVELGPKFRHPGQASRRRGIGMVLGSLVLAGVLNVPLILEARRETPSRPSISAELFSSDTSFKEVQAISDGSTPIEDLTEDSLKQVDATQVHFNSTSLGSLIDARFVSNPLNSTPGRLAYLVGLFGLLTAGRRTWGWLAIAFGATVLSLGPFLNVSGALILNSEATHWPLPYYWAHEYLPFFSKAYRPYRIGVIAMTALAATGAIGAAAVLRSGALPVPLFWVALLALLGFSQPHWIGEKPGSQPLADARIGPIYTELAALEPGAVIELPLHYQPISTANARSQFVQTKHKHPILNSNQLIRWPDLLRFQGFVTSNSALSTFVNLSRSQPPYVVEGEDITALSELGFRWIVAHKQVPSDDIALTGDMANADLLGPSAWMLLEKMFGNPVLDNGDSVVWDVNESTGERIVVSGQNVEPIPIELDPVLDDLPLVLKNGQTIPLFEGHASWFAAWVRPVSEVTQGDLVLRIEDGGVVREVALNLVSGHWRYVYIPIDSAGKTTLSLVGRGDGLLQFELLSASVIQ